MSRDAPEDREAMARSVVIKIICTGLLAIAVLLLGDTWMDWKLSRISADMDLISEAMDTLRRSNAAHFGQIKKMIAD